ncbi:papain family cysteine protease, partial [Trifolium medium]|nr:papain family cysteine protease [Trifolium medium]
LEAEHDEQRRYNVERRRKVDVEIRGRSRVGRSRVRRHVENDNSGYVSRKEHDQQGGVENLGSEYRRFSNVRDVTKLTKALNAVCFGHFRVRARVASFDRFDRNVTAEEKGPGSQGDSG